MTMLDHAEVQGHRSAHQHDLRPLHHSHRFGDTHAPARAKALRTVTWLTLVTMLAELIAGYWSGSLALTADGWHMGTHAAALGGAALAMGWSRKVDDLSDGHFAFGGWKIEVLTAYTSALLLAATAVSLIVDSVRALWSPQPVAYGEAMAVAVLGLLVNLASVWLLGRSSEPASHAHAQSQRPAAAHGHGEGYAHGHAHGHSQGHGHGHGHDHNFSAAYLHVLADAFTSVLAIVALAGGLWWGWRWLDPVVALFGALVIAQWSWGLLRSSGKALVDATAEPALREAVRAAIESDGDAKLSDLHVWQVGANSWATAVAIVADQPLAANTYRERLAPIKSLGHVTIEVHRCAGERDGARP